VTQPENTWERLKKILVIAVPAALALVTQGAINQVDFYFVGQIGGALDPTPLAAVIGWDATPAIDGASFVQEQVRASQAAMGISMKVLWLFAGALASLAIGTQAMVARRFGESDEASVGAVAINSVAASVAASGLFTVIGLLSLEPLFHYISSAAPGVVEAGVQFSEIRLFALLGIVWTASHRAFFDGLGKTWIFMVIAVLMNTINVVLDYAMVFGTWGIPRFGPNGAAWASFVSAFVGLALLVMWTNWGSFRRFKMWNLKRISPTLMWRICTFSLPNAVATAGMTAGFLLFDKVIAELDKIRVEEALVGVVGAENFAGMSEVVRETTMSLHHIPADLYQSTSQLIIVVMMLFFMVGFGFGLAAATLVSQSLGAGDPEGASRNGWMTIWVGGGIVAVFGMGLVFFPESIAAVFNPGDPLVQETAAGPLRGVGFAAFFIAASLILTQALYSAGMPIYVAVVTLAGICWLVPGGWWLAISLGYGYAGIWAAAGGFILILTVGMGGMFLTDRWKNISI
jgi:multidrug resistance protein, MATE family